MSAALLIVDMQNEFVSRGDYCDRRQNGETATALEAPGEPQPFTVRTPALGKVVDRVAGEIGRARREGWPIVFVLATYGREFSWQPRFLLGPENARRRHHACKPGTWGSRLVDPIAALLPRSGGKERDSPAQEHARRIFGTDLQAFLSSRSVKTVGVVGVETHACVLSTAMSAGLHQFDTVILEDCTWTAKPDLGQMALQLFADAFGRTTTSDLFR